MQIISKKNYNNPLVIEPVKGLLKLWLLYEEDSQA